MRNIRAPFGDRRRVPRNFLAAALLILVPACLVTGSALSTTPGLDVWIADSRGIAALSAADGSLPLELALSPDPRALAVDGQDKRVWVFAGREVRAYDFSGQLKTSTPVSPPVGNPALLAVDAQAGREWLAVSNQLYLLDAFGTVLKQLRFPQPVIGVTLDRRRSRLWVAYKGAIAVFDQDGSEIQRVSAPDLKVLRSLDYDVNHDEVWVAADDLLQRYSPSGAQVASIRNDWFSSVAFVAADFRGGVWLASQRQLANVSSGGGVTVVLTPYPGSNPEAIVDLVADPIDGSVWTASQNRISHFSSGGALLRDYVPVGADGKNRVIRQIALETRPIAPQIEITFPTTDSVLNVARPTVRLTYSGEEINLNSLQLAVDGAAVATNCQALPDSASCEFAQGLSEGIHDISATIANLAGNTSQPATVRVTIDTIAPVIQVNSPSEGFLTNSTSAQLQGSLSEQATVTVNGQTASVQGNLFTSGPHPLSEGVNVFNVRALDRAGNSGLAQRTVVRDTIPPAAPAPTLVQAQVSNGQIAITGRAGSVEGGARVKIVNTATGASVTVVANADGSFSATIAGSGGDLLRVSATDAAGNQGAITEVTVASGGPFSGPIRITAISPANGATVNGDRVLVGIDLQAPPNTGITIADVVAVPAAAPSGLRYYAEVPLTVGQNTLPIMVTGQDGRTLSQSLTLSSTGPYAYRVIADQSTGVSPLNITFRVLDQLGLGIRQIQVDFDRNGSIDFTTNDSAGAIATTLVGVGLRQPRFIVFDNSGQGHIQNANVLLFDPAIVDQSVGAIWSGMITALAAGNKDSAMQFLSENARDQYGPVFDVLMVRMPELVATFSEPRRSLVSPQFAEYGINRTIDSIQRVFLVDFVVTEQGQWRLESM